MGEWCWKKLYQHKTAVSGHHQLLQETVEEPSDSQMTPLLATFAPWFPWLDIARCPVWCRFVSFVSTPLPFKICALIKFMASLDSLNSA